MGIDRKWENNLFLYNSTYIHYNRLYHCISYCISGKQRQLSLHITFYDKKTCPVKKDDT